MKINFLYIFTLMGLSFFSNIAEADDMKKAPIDTVFEQFWTIFSVIHVLKLNQTTGM